METAERDALAYWYWHGSNEPIRGESPAAGASFAHTVPGTVEQEVVAVSFLFTASAAAATRRPVIRFLDYGGQSFAEIGTPFTITANNASQVTFAQSIVQLGANNSARMGAAIPPLRLGDGLSFEVTADNIDAGDQISAVAFFVRQWPIRP